MISPKSVTPFWESQGGQGQVITYTPMGILYCSDVCWYGVKNDSNYFTGKHQFQWPGSSNFTIIPAMTVWNDCKTTQFQKQLC